MARKSKTKRKTKSKAKPRRKTNKPRRRSSSVAKKKSGRGSRARAGLGRIQSSLKTGVVGDAIKGAGAARLSHNSRLQHFEVQK